MSDPDLADAIQDPEKSSLVDPEVKKAFTNAGRESDSWLVDPEVRDYFKGRAKTRAALQGAIKAQEPGGLTKAAMYGGAIVAKGLEGAFEGTVGAVAKAGIAAGERLAGLTAAGGAFLEGATIETLPQDVKDMLAGKASQKINEYVNLPTVAGAVLSPITGLNPAEAAQRHAAGMAEVGKMPANEFFQTVAYGAGYVGSMLSGGLSGQVFSGASKAVEEPAANLVGRIAANLGEKAVERGATTLEKLQQAYAQGRYLPEVVRSVSSSPLIQKALEKTLKYAPKMAGAAAGSAALGTLSQVERGTADPTTFAYSAIAGAALPLVSRLAEMGQGALIAKLGEGAWSKATAASVAAAIEGTGFTLTDVHAVGPLMKHLVDGDTEALKKDLAFLAGTSLAIGFARGRTPSQMLAWRREHPEEANIPEPIMAELDKRLQDRRAEMMAPMADLVRHGWKISIQEEGPIDLRLAGVPGKVSVLPDGTLRLGPEQRKLAQSDVAELPLKSPEAAVALERIANATMMSNAVSHAVFGGKGEEMGWDGTYFDGTQRGAFRFNRLRRQSTEPGSAWEDVPGDAEFTNPQGRMLATDPTYGPGLINLRRLVDQAWQARAAKKEGEAAAAKGDISRQELAEAMVSLLEHTSVEDGFRSRAQAEAMLLLADPRVQQMQARSPEEAVRLVDAIAKKLGDVMGGAVTAKAALASVEGMPGKRGQPSKGAEVQPSRQPEVGREEVGGYGGSQEIPLIRDMEGTAKLGEYKQRLSEVMGSLEKLAGSPIRAGGGAFQEIEGLAGYHNPFTRAVRTRYPLDIQVGVHEAGHGLHRRLESHYDEPMPPEVAAELTTAGQRLYGSRVPGVGHYRREGMAEYVALKMLAEPKRGDIDVTKEYPAITKWLDKRLAEDPELRAQWEEVAQRFEAYRKQGAKGVLRSMIHLVSDKELDKLPLGERMKEWQRRYRTANFDILSKLRDAELEQRLKDPEFGGWQEVRPSQSPYLTALAVSGAATGQAKNAIMHELGDLSGSYRGPSLRDAFKENVHRGELSEFWTYALARRLKQRQEIHEANLAKKAADPTFEVPTIEAGPSKEMLDYVIDTTRAETPEKAARFDEVLARLTEWNHNLLLYYKDAGGISDKDFKDIVDSEDIYFTIKRKFDEINEGADLRQAFVAGRSQLGGKGQAKRFKGSSREIEDPMVTAFHKAVGVFSAANKIQVQRALYEMVKSSEGSSWLAEEVGAPLPGQQNVVSLVVNGKTVHMQVHPEVVEALAGLDAITTHATLRWARFFTEATRLAATGISIPFSLTQAIKDAFTGFTTTRVGHGLMRLVPRFLQTRGILDQIAYALKTREGTTGPLEGMGAATQKARALGLDTATWAGHLWRESERLVGDVAPKTKEPISSPIDVAKAAARSVARTVERIANVLSIQDKAIRITEMKLMMEQLQREHPDWTDVDIAHAGMLAAKDITLNFGRQGSITGALNRYAAYSSAFAAGTSKFYRTYFSKEYGAGQTAANWIRTIATVTVPTMIYWWLNKDDKRFQMKTADERRRNWYFFIGDREFRVPKPEGAVGDLFSTAIEGALDHTYKQDPAVLKSSIQDMIINMLPLAPLIQVEGSAIPTLGLPRRLVLNVTTVPIELWSGKDLLTGRNIENWGDERKLPGDRVSPWTTGLSKALGDMFPETISPKKMDIILRDLVGSLPLRAAQFWDLISGAVDEDHATFPILSRFLSHDSTGYSKQTGEVHRLATELEQKENSGRLTEKEAEMKPAIDAANRTINNLRQAAKKGMMTPKEANQEAQQVAEEALKR